jgi:AraC-like DNA-binding protein
LISSRKHFDFKGKCILEKLTIEGSSRINIDFPTEACYLYVREGRIVVSGVNLAAPLTSNEAVVLNCGHYIADFVNASPHSITEVLAIHLHPDILHEIFRNELPAFVKADANPILPSKIITNSILEKFIESLAFYLDNPHIVTEDILILKVRELILLLVQSTHAENVYKLFSSLFSRKTVTISEVIKTHLYSNFSVRELAKLAGLSLTSFKSEFVSVYRESPARYIRKKKIERAKELLLTSDFSIGEIADQVGYKDVSHFSKSFQFLTGTSPTNFRSDFKVK